MINRIYTLFVAVLLSSAMLVVAGCGASGNSTANGQGGVTAKLVWNGKSGVAKSVASAPTGVTTVRLAISGTGITTVQQDFQSSLGVGTLSSVPSGSGYTYTAYGLDATNNIIYQGSVSNITVQVGKTTDVGTVNMLPVVTSAMISGKTFTHSNSTGITGTITFKTDGTFSGTASDGQISGAWSINSSGQLVLKGSGGTETDTMTLTGGATSTLTFSSYEVDSSTTPTTTRTVTVTFAAYTPPTYSNASLSGVWISSSMGVNATTPMYFVMDGAGTITDISAFNLSTPAGTYSVNADGTYSMPLGEIAFSGKLASTTTGTITYSGASSTGSLTKVADLSKGQGSYTATLSGGAQTFATYTISFSVDASGNISSFASSIPGATTAKSGKFFSLADGTAVFMIRTNATDEYSQIKGTGTLVNGQITGGVLELDSNVANGTFTLAPQLKFTTAMVSGKTLYWADKRGYGYFRFTSTGTLYGTGDINIDGNTEGGPYPYTINTDGSLTYGSTNSATILSNNTTGNYWRVQLSTGVERWFYGATAAADAQAFWTSQVNP